MILEPKKLRPDSTDCRSAETAVITPMTEKTPIVIPSIVSAERSLFTPKEPRAMRRISVNFMRVLFVSQCHHRIEPGGAPRRRKTGNDARQNGNRHADKNKAYREFDGDSRKRRADRQHEPISQPEADEAADQTNRNGLNQKLQ